MKILERGRGRVHRVVATAVAAGSLIALQTLVATPAQAVTTCSITGGTLTVVAPDAGAIVLVGADANGVISVASNIGGPIVACTGGVATTATITAITASGGNGNQTFEIAMYKIASPPAVGGGHFTADASPSATNWGTINWTVSLGTSAGDADVLAVYNTPGTTALNTTVGVTGIDLTTDGDVDVSYSGVETIAIDGSNNGTVFDSISGAGDTATGAAATTKLVVNGNGGDDTIGGGAGNDTLHGDAGDDTVSGGAGDDALFGDAGTADRVDYSASTTGVNVNLTSGVATGQGLDTLSGFERVTGSAQNDVLTGNAGDNRLRPGMGDDTVAGGAGADRVEYVNVDGPVTIDLAAQKVTGAGTDTLSSIENASGSPGDDTFVDAAETNNLMLGQGGNDTFDQGDDPGGFVVEADTIDGEGGRDTVDYSARTQPLTINLNTGSFTLDTIGYLCTPDGGTPGTPGAARLSGDSGDLEGDIITDVENASVGDAGDTFGGNNFNNNVFDLGGQNQLTGCSGIDSLNYKDREDAVTVNLAGGGPAGTGDSANGFENAVGSKGDDTLLGSDSANELKGLGGKDSISGNNGADFTIGGGGADNIKSGSGDDTLKGKGGSDHLRGGSGDDDLIGGKGKDTCDGGSGSDVIKGCENKKKKGKQKQLMAAREAKLAKLG